MFRSIQCSVICASAFVLPLSMLSTARASLEEGQVLLLFNHFDDESAAIAAEYIKLHKDVVPLDLDIDYADPKSWPNTCERYEGGYDINRYYVTAAAFQCWIKDPLYSYITDYNLKEAPDIIAIVTTRGIPAAIAEDFVDRCPVPDPKADPPIGPLCPGPGQHHILSSVEAQLSRLGGEGLQVEPNPYVHRLDYPFEDFLTSTTCLSTGPSYAGKMFLVSRLDSGPVDGSHLDGVLELIDRSISLSVDQASVVLVYDDCPCQNGLMLIHTRGAGYMRERGWQVFYDNSSAFLNGSLSDPRCGGMIWEERVEGLYDDCPELVHVTSGFNHYVFCERYCASEYVCPAYTRMFHNTHSAGLLISEESFDGWTIHQPVGIEVSQGQVLEWIAGGGSFSCGNVDEPQANPVDSSYIVANLYEHGLSWGEAVYTGLHYLGQFQTPVGDPLALVTVRRGSAHTCSSELEPPDFEYPTCGPGGFQWFHCFGDLNHDGTVDGIDVGMLLSLWDCPCQDGDLNGDGSTNGLDLGILLGNWGVLTDLNDDRVVDCFDRAILVDAIGEPYVAAYDFDCDGEITMLDLSAAVWVDWDVNGDKELTCDDVCTVFGHCCGSAHYDPHYDINCDGEVDMSDVLQIDERVSQLLRIETCLPCPR